jgi:hypothetical protein
LIEGELEQQLLEVRLVGTYQGIAHLLHDLTHLENITDVESLRMQQGEGHTLNADLTIACYFRMSDELDADTNWPKSGISQ